MESFVEAIFSGEEWHGTLTKKQLRHKHNVNYEDFLKKEDVGENERKKSLNTLDFFKNALRPFKDDSLTVLHLAIVLNRAQVVERLISIGADVHACTGKGKSLQSLVPNRKIREIINRAEQNHRKEDEKDSDPFGELHKRLIGERHPSRVKELLPELKKCALAVKRSKEREISKLAFTIEKLETQLATARSKSGQLKTFIDYVDDKLGEAEQHLADRWIAFQEQVRDMTVEDVADWISTVDNGAFSKYANGFRTNEIDGKELLTFCSQADLQECGVTVRRVRRELWAHIVALFQRAGVRVGDEENFR